MSTKLQTRWVVSDLQELSKEFEGQDFILSQLLLQRGVTTKQDAEKFLKPSLDDLGNPFDLVGMKEAVARIRYAVQTGEKIVIYGDYDVDGVTSATVLRRCLSEMGAEVQVYLPERIKEGYGLNDKAITKLAKDGAKLMITVDTGTTAVDEIASATKLNMDVIVVDHHHVPEILPECVAVINPHRDEQKYSFKDLAAVGVAYRLACALVGDKANDWLDLVALGTVADVVPLVGENRTLTVFGLEVLNRTTNLGIKALVDVAGLHDKKLDVFHIGFQLGPRLNAAGRIDHAQLAYELLNTDDVEKVKESANMLNDLNARRKDMTQEILESVEMRSKDWDKEKIIIVENEGWSVGVVGIVAGRLTEKYSKPSIVFDKQDEVYKGSARSVDGVHIVELLNEVKEYLEGYGGHAKAAGMTVSLNKYADFKKMLLGAAQEKIDEKLLFPSISISLVLDVVEITDELLATVEKMAPFGFGNSTPVFGVKNVRLKYVDRFGEVVTKMKFEDVQGNLVEVIGFDRDNELNNRLVKGQTYNVAFNMSVNEWKDRKYRQQKLVNLVEIV
jgi:single-stranded-DNA-specific exonuclease